KQIASDTVKKEIRRRSSAEDLKAAGILKTSVEEGAGKLEGQMRKQSLDKKVGRRPSMQEIGDLGLLNKEDVVEDAVVPEKKAEPKKRFFGLF
ncbi:hypothetical protein TeGR_g13620, partial [Tetraparma gracilis]